LLRFKNGASIVLRRGYAGRYPINAPFDPADACSLIANASADFDDAIVRHAIRCDWFKLNKRGGAAAYDFLEVHDFRGAAHLAIRIAGKRFADEIRGVKRLPSLADACRLQSFDEADERLGFGRGRVEKTLPRKRRPLSVDAVE
jgi:hypothetical protein